MSKNTRKLPLTEEQLLESDRLKALFEGKKKELGLTQEKIAAELGDGVTQGAVSHFLNRRTALNLEAAVVFARLLKVPVAAFSERLAADLDRLRDGTPGLSSSAPEAPAVKDEVASRDHQGVDLEKYTFIDQYDARAAAGPGYENQHFALRNTLAFKTDWLRAKGAKAKNLKVIYAHGESMWPTISDHDVLLVDESCIEPVDGQIFVMGTLDGDIVKRLIQTEYGDWIVCSDNPDKTRYPDKELSEEEINEHRLLGRVIWRGGDL